MFVEPDPEYVMSIYVQQLRLLLGIPDADGFEDGEIIKPLTHLRLWEKDSLIRTRTVEQLTSAKHTLQVFNKKKTPILFIKNLSNFFSLISVVVKTFRKNQ